MLQKIRVLQICVIVACSLFASRIESEIVQENARSGVTLVSAFLSNVNKRNDRNVDDYIQWAEHLLNCNVPKVIFVEQWVYDSFYRDKDTLGFFPQTYFVPIEKDSLFLNSARNQITNFRVHGNPSKDTLDYMLLVCNKTEWVNQAIDLNIFDTEQFVWVDFGLYYVVNDPELFDRSLHDLTDKMKFYDNVRIGSIWNLHEFPKDKGIKALRNVAWYFAGGVFGGHKDALVLFNQLMKEKCLDIIKNAHTISWEVNVWFMIYLENEYLFSPYCCNHNSSLLSNY